MSDDMSDDMYPLSAYSSSRVRSAPIPIPASSNACPLHTRLAYKQVMLASVDSDVGNGFSSLPAGWAPTHVHVPTVRSLFLAEFIERMNDRQVGSPPRAHRKYWTSQDLEDACMEEIDAVQRRAHVHHQLPTVSPRERSYSSVPSFFVQYENGTVGNEQPGAVVNDNEMVDEGTHTDDAGASTSHAPTAMSKPMPVKSG